MAMRCERSCKGQGRVGRRPSTDGGAGGNDHKSSGSQEPEEKCLARLALARLCVGGEG